MKHHKTKGFVLNKKSVHHKIEGFKNSTFSKISK